MNYELAIALAVGWLLDLLLGDPERLPHPVVGMGRWIAFWEKRLNKGNHRKVKGALLTVFSLLLCYGLIVVFLHFSHKLSSSIMGSWGEALLIFFCLAGHTLRQEVRKVFEALDRSLDEGRRQVARIVGRDTSELSAQEIRTAALETLAENLSDGVIAPLFWLALGGVPAMVTYKMVNTLDSMIGYRTERYKDFGCWAARIDDIANFIPARLTALLMVLAAGKPQLIAFVWRNGRKHASPNSGYPEAALAGALNCRFGGPHYYFGELFDKPYIGENARELTTADMQKAVRVNRIAEIFAIVIIIVIYCL